MTIEERLERDEGFVPHAYQDHLGYWTIGIGTLIDKRKGGRISRAAALFMLDEKLAEIMADLDRWIPWWRGLDRTRREVLVTMAYQLGVTGLLKFENTLGAVRRGDYAAAADGMLASKWGRLDTPARAARAAHAMRTGEWPTETTG